MNKNKKSIDYRESLIDRLKNNEEEAGLSRESLYRTLSENGNPKLETVFKMLHAMGMKLSVEPINIEWEKITSAPFHDNVCYREMDF